MSLTFHDFFLTTNHSKISNKMPSNTKFSTEKIPDLSGKVAIVTGGNAVSHSKGKRGCF